MIYDAFTLQWSVKRPKNGKLGIFKAVEDNGTVFAPRQALHQKVAMGLENLKIQSLSRCNKRTGRYGPANNPVSCTESSPKNGNFGIFEAVEDNGTVFRTRQCLHRKVHMCMENLKMQSLSPCNKRTGRYGRQITRFHPPGKSPKKESLDISKLSKTMVPSLHQGKDYIKR